MTESSFTILRVRGIPIGVHWTWLLVFAIVVWSLGTVLFPASYPGLDGATYLAMAVAAALLFFGSVLAHELGHALRALDEGQQSEERERRRVRDLMVPGHEVPTVSPDQEVVDTLAALGDRGTRAMVTGPDGRLVGVLSAADVAHALEIERLRGEQQPEPAARGPGLLVWAVVAVILLGAGAALYHPPYVVIAPGEAADLGRDITISGTATTPLTGRYLLTSVRLERASGLGTLLAALRTDRDVVPVGRVLPKGVNPREYAESQRAVFQESRRLAAAAAARAAGLPVRV
ncbi:MAG: CBS domain-containing protein, partial [Actinomycetota bacterium]